MLKPIPYIIAFLAGLNVAPTALGRNTAEGGCWIGIPWEDVPELCRQEGVYR